MGREAQRSLCHESEFWPPVSARHTQMGPEHLGATRGQVRRARGGQPRTMWHSWSRSPGNWRQAGGCPQRVPSGFRPLEMGSPVAANRRPARGPHFPEVRGPLVGEGAAAGTRWAKCRVFRGTHVGRSITHNLSPLSSATTRENPRTGIPGIAEGWNHSWCLCVQRA